MLKDLRHAVRLLLQAKGWTAVVLLSLALGIGANTTLFTVVNGLLLRSVPVRDPDSLVRVRWTGPNDALTNHSEYGRIRSESGGDAAGAAFSYPMFEQLRAANRTLSDLIACAPFGRVNVVVDGQADTARSFISSGNYYGALGVRATMGRLLEPADDRPGAPATAVISHRFWHSRFGATPAAIGKTIRINDVPVTIVGVVAPEFTGIQEPIGEPPDIGLPLALEAPLRGVQPPLESGGSASKEIVTVRSSLNDASNWWLEVVGRVRPGVTPAQVEANLGPVFQHTARANLDQYLSSLSEAERSSSDSVSRTSIPRLRVEPGARGVYDTDTTLVRSAMLLMAAVGVLLLIVCANVANLLLSRATARQKEIAIRLSMGATRRRLIRQLLTESLVLSAAGGVVGILFGLLGQRLLPDTVGRPSPIDWHVVAFVVGVVLLTSVVFGLAPAATATRVTLHTALKTQGRGVVGQRRRLSKSLLVAQVALALVLLVGAGLFMRTTRNLGRVDVGFNPENLLLVTINPQLNHYDPPRAFALYDGLLRDLRALPGVRAAALSMPALLAGNTNIGGVYIQGRAYTRGQSSTDRMHRVVVSPTFFDTMEIPISLGRGLTDRDREGAAPVVVINEAAVRQYFRNMNPVGQRFGHSFEDRSHFEIVGVVRDARYDSLRDLAPPTMYVPQRQTRTVNATLEIRTAGPPTAAAGDVRRVVRQHDATLPLMNVSTQLDQIENRFQDERVFAQAYGFFGAIAVVLASIGLFGLMSYTVARRTGEIGIRMALGAQRPHVLGLVMRESMLLVSVGVAIGLTIALAAGRFVRALLFGLAPTDGLSITAAVAIMLCVSGAAAYLPARRASRIDPLAALRQD